jgi:hypothetical protein
VLNFSPDALRNPAALKKPGRLPKMGDQIESDPGPAVVLRMKGSLPNFCKNVIIFLGVSA